MEPKYKPKEHEKKIYELWEKNEAFSPKAAKEKFSIVIPPPNVTGSLHMGHALNNTMQDILIRWARLQGKETVWVPGTDHAGIATQNVVEKELLKQGIKKQDLGREEFLKKVEEWVEKYGHIIIDQLKQLGCSCDWSRERFTMDEDYQKLVKETFLHYHEKGLIYQADRVINWCVRCQTALSDIEVEHQNQKTKLYYFRYDKNFPITIATTRPETKLGDSAVAIHPDDPRYKKYIGKSFQVNFVGVKRKIKIISDPMIDAKFGTGALGVTPAHSLIDAEMAEKNNLPSIIVIDKYGKMTDKAGEFAEMKAEEARAKIVAMLEKEGLLEKTEEIENALSVCYRCHKAIEAQPSKQWFLKMKELAQPAIAAVKSGKIKFTPKRWEKVYLDWMENLRDWCVSRQIWWGHKIPLEGETDVLDTWFPSALWAHGVWKNKEDFEKFYPTSVLSTARDILFLWVARMIFSGLEFTNKIPFAKVYIHPTIFNIEGKRMSKSLGTGVDPLELIEKYGADAVRFGLTFQNTGTQDIKFSEDAILAGQKFANKLWNIARFIEMQGKDSGEYKIVTAADKNIIEKLDNVKKTTAENIEHFRFGQMAHELYDFVWHDFADIYLEESKKQMSENTIKILNSVLQNILILLHPTMPFVTESIYQNLFASRSKSRFLITSRLS